MLDSIGSKKKRQTLPVRPMARAKSKKMKRPKSKQGISSQEILLTANSSPGKDLGLTDEYVSGVDPRFDG